VTRSYFVERGSQMFVRFQDHGLVEATGAEAAVTRGWRVVARVRSAKTGRLQVFDTFEQATLGSLVTGGTLVNPDTKAPDDGEAVQVSATSFRNFNRGQLYMTVAFGLDEVSAQIVARGYVWAGHNLHLGEDVDPGPDDGHGNFYLLRVSLADAAGNTTTTVPGAVANTYRKYYGFVMYYNADGNAASRILTVNVQMPWAPALPTGFATPGNANVVEQTGPTLTLGQEGTFFQYAWEHGSGYISKNAAGTVTVGNTASEPLVWPLFVKFTDAVIFEFLAAAGLAGDVYEVWMLVEEWVVL